MKKNTILVVDDDREDHMILLEYFSGEGLDMFVTFIDNGQKAIEYLESLKDPDDMPRLIILDLNMPKLNGVQTLERIKRDERFNKIPVIIYSTSINPLEKEKCLKLGAHSYVTKPVSLNESMETARMFLTFCAAGAV